ncbi:MAG TPA: aldo/keto reductase [Actinomycetales bacterium]|nr:aldo/keto reductase [Actinomycetales bacterium]
MSDLVLGPLGYGAAAVGNLYRAKDDDEARRILDAAWDAAIRYFDTAPHYGLGLSERRLGTMLRERPRDSFVLSTKVGRLLVPNPPGAARRDDDLFEVPADHRRVWDFSPAGIRQSLEESLVRLGLDFVDVLYLHDPELSGGDLHQTVDSGVQALSDLRAEGLVREIGIGSEDVVAIDLAVRTGELDLVMLAGRYTLLESPAVTTTVPLCRAYGVRIVNAAVFNSGLLATPNPAADSHYRYGTVPADKLARARELARICADFDVELPAAALQYSLRDDVVAGVVAGADSAEQVRQNASRIRAPIPEELWHTLEEKGLIQ